MEFPYKIKDINHLLIEMNYSDDILIDKLCDNVDIRSNNQYHMEANETLKSIKNLYNSDMQTIILLHLSDGQSNEGLFMKMVFEEVGIMPFVADKGLVVDINKEEF